MSIKHLKLHFLQSGLLDMSIRMCSIVAKAFTIFFVAKKLSANEFGVYVVMQASVSLYQYMVASDLSYVTHRQLIQKRIDLSSLIGTQAPLNFFTYLAACGLLFLSFPESIGVNLFFLTITILLFESISSELQRILAASCKFTSANLALFIKTAAWLPMLITYWRFHEPTMISLAYFWLIGLVLSSAYGILILWKIMPSKKLCWSHRLFVDITKTIPIVLLGTMATRALFSIDRLIVESKDGLVIAGAYGFYVGVAAAFVAVLDSGILLRKHPEIVSAADSKDFILVAKIIKSIIFKVGIATLAAVAGFYLVNNYVLSIIDKIEYGNYSQIGSVLIISYGVYSLSFGPQSFLYGLHKDISLSIINFISLIPLTLILFVKIDIWKVMPLIILSCTIIQFLLKGYLYLRVVKLEER